MSITMQDRKTSSTCARKMSSPIKKVVSKKSRLRKPSSEFTKKSKTDATSKKAPCDRKFVKPKSSQLKSQDGVRRTATRELLQSRSLRRAKCTVLDTFMNSMKMQETTRDRHTGPAVTARTGHEGGSKTLPRGKAEVSRVTRNSYSFNKKAADKTTDKTLPLKTRKTTNSVKSESPNEPNLKIKTPTPSRLPIRKEPKMKRAGGDVKSEDKDSSNTEDNIKKPEAEPTVKKSNLDLLKYFTYTCKLPFEEEVSRIDAKYMESILQITKDSQKLICPGEAEEKDPVKQSMKKVNEGNQEETVVADKKKRKKRQAKGDETGTASESCHETVTNDDASIKPEKLTKEKSLSDMSSMGKPKFGTTSKLPRSVTNKWKEEEGKMAKTKSEKLVSHSNSAFDDKSARKSRTKNLKGTKKVDVVEKPFSDEGSNVKEIWRSDVRVPSDNSLSVESNPSGSSCSLVMDCKVYDQENLGINSYQTLKRIIEEEVLRIWNNRKVPDSASENKVDQQDMAETEQKPQTPEVKRMTLAETKILEKKLCKKQTSTGLGTVKSDRRDSNVIDVKRSAEKSREKNTERPETPRPIPAKQRVEPIATDKSPSEDIVTDSEKLPADIIKNWSILRRLEKAFAALGSSNPTTKIKPSVGDEILKTDKSTDEKPPCSGTKVQPIELPPQDLRVESVETTRKPEKGKVETYYLALDSSVDQERPKGPQIKIGNQNLVSVPRKPSQTGTILIAEQWRSSQKREKVDKAVSSRIKTVDRGKGKGTGERTSKTGVQGENQGSTSMPKDISNVITKSLVAELEEFATSHVSKIYGNNQPRDKVSTGIKLDRKGTFDVIPKSAVTEMTCQSYTKLMGGSEKSGTVQTGQPPKRPQSNIKTNAQSERISKKRSILSVRGSQQNKNLSERSPDAHVNIGQHPAKPANISPPEEPTSSSPAKVDGTNDSLSSNASKLRGGPTCAPRAGNPPHAETPQKNKSLTKLQEKFTERKNWEKDIKKYREIVADIMKQYQRTDGLLRQNETAGKDESSWRNSAVRHNVSVYSDIEEYRNKILTEYSQVPIFEYKSRVLNGSRSVVGHGPGNLSVVYSNADVDTDADVKDYQPNVQRILDAQFYVDVSNIGRRHETSPHKQPSTYFSDEVVTVRGRETSESGRLPLGGPFSSFRLAPDTCKRPPPLPKSNGSTAGPSPYKATNGKILRACPTRSNAVVR